MRKLILFTATGGGAGYSPIAPGTVGSLVGSIGFGVLAVGLEWPALGLVSMLLVLVALGIWSSGRAELLFSRKDDGRITIDEVAGVWLALLWLPAHIEVLVAGFFLFRLFDIWKPPPVRWCESLGGGLGVVTDDLVAGVYANLAGQLLWRVILPEGWM